MATPIIGPDGHSYERAALETCLARNRVSPQTRQPWPPGPLVINYKLRDAIEAWQNESPLAVDESRLTFSSPEVVLGRGASGVVVAATLKTGTQELPVAVKRLPMVGGAETRDRIEKELKAHIEAQQRADGVCRLLATCEKNGNFYLVMRRYNCSLADRIATGPSLSDEDVCNIARSLFRTLEQLHAGGFVVRDIKPENILLDRFLCPYLSDFGVSRILETTQITPTTVLGTANYMAPEQLSGRAFGVEVDVWAMACVIVQMVTGVAPWNTDLRDRIYVLVTQEKRVPNVPAKTPAAEILKRCFAFSPVDRPTAAEVASVLSAEQHAALPESVIDAFARRVDELERESDTLRTQLAGATYRCDQEVQAANVARAELAGARRDLASAREKAHMADVDKDVIREQMRSKEKEYGQRQGVLTREMNALRRQLRDMEIRARNAETILEQQRREEEAKRAQAEAIAAARPQKVKDSLELLQIHQAFSLRNVSAGCRLEIVQDYRTQRQEKQCEWDVSSNRDSL